ncbi:MAG TPA: MOSC domain-containing protein [Candidatus Sulfopaludibacter sp.]|jgi:MOSC domain-containing protein YiiM|nr:MOSC domain-containing protein [Candidatus Sulfopaludibacter sp.]
MDAVILQVNTSPGGLPKRPIGRGFIAPLGLNGDEHAHPEIHGGVEKAILLIAAETVDAFTARGYPIFYGALGENLTVRGLDIRSLRIGDQLRAGGALLEITKPRGPCRQLDVYGEMLKAEIYDAKVKQGDFSSPRWGMSGFYMKVVEPGPVQAGDLITVFSHLA